MKKQFIIMSVEPISSRYTLEWHTHLPKVFSEKLGSDFDVIQIDGVSKSERPTPGAFLDFEATNLWKSEQSLKFFEMMKEGRIQDDAIILFTDAWNPVAIQLKYTKDLCNKNWKLIGIWHAGGYDPNDFLGRIKDKTWIEHFENSLHFAYDINWFATFDHIKLWSASRKLNRKSIVRSGFPMEYILDIPFPKVEKENQIIFPGRLAPEKQPEIVKQLEKMLPDYKFFFCLEHNLSKEEYWLEMAKSKIMLSVSLQETFGITILESLVANCIPLCPNRLCYSEMYGNFENILYPSEWSLNPIDYNKLKDKIKFTLENYDSIVKNDIIKNKETLFENYMQCNIIINHIIEFL